MSKRNFILLIITLAIVIVIIFGFLYFNKPQTPDGDNTTSGINFLSEFNPFKKSKPEPSNPTPDNGETPGTGNQAEEMGLRKISSMPVAGFMVFPKERYSEPPAISTLETGQPVTTGATPTETKPTPPPTEFAPALRYVARSNGNIYQTFADKVEERKFSTTIIPKIYESYFGKNGESVAMRYLKPDEKTITTFVGTLPKEMLGGDTTDTNEIKGVFLPDNISDLSISPDYTQIFYLLNLADGVVGVTSSFAGDKKVQIFDSAFTEWLSQWPNSKMVTLTTKPSAQVAGYMYAIDPTKKDFRRVLSGINGLTTLTSPNGKLVLYSDNSLYLNIYNTENGSTVGLATRSMPEKCVWDKTSTYIYCAAPKEVSGGDFPDAWYKGEVSFSDQLWKINTQTGTGALLIDPASQVALEEFDGIKLGLDQDEKFLFFVNKKDSFLWEFKLN